MPAPVTIERTGWVAPLDKSLVAVGGTTSDEIPILTAAFGGLLVPATVNGTSIGFLVGDKAGGTFATLKKTDGTAVTITTVDATVSAHPLQAELFGFNYFKIVCGSTQTSTDTQFIVTLRA